MILLPQVLTFHQSVTLILSGRETVLTSLVAMMVSYSVSQSPIPRYETMYNIVLPYYCIAIVVLSSRITSDIIVILFITLNISKVLNV